MRFAIISAISILISLLFGIDKSLAQACKDPYSISFLERTTNSAKIKWSDQNSAPIGWEIELVEFGNLPTGTPSYPLITTKEFTIDGLTSSTSYTLHIRAVCGVNSYSAWNIVVFTTQLSNPTACGINLPIKDNGIETFYFEVSQTGKLGKDVFFDSVDFIIKHGWPADLKISLEAPDGSQIVLSNHNGTITDDFGNISDAGCTQTTSFRNYACQKLKNSKPPFVGSFLPDDPFSKLNGTEVNGIWKLIFFDRAQKDAGNLLYFNMALTTEKCKLPDSYTISKIGNNIATLSWEFFQGCKTIIAVVTEDGKMPSNPIIINCNDKKWTFDGLSPNTTYTISFYSNCGTSVSNSSCNIVFTTTCEPVSLQEKFDTSSKCMEGCSTTCALNSTQWYNITDGDQQDWIVWNGKTDTENTGPSTDVSGIGNYIYIENNPTLCGNNQTIILQSECIDVKSNESGCDMSFNYHMYGKDISSLSLLISTNSGENWDTLFHLAGDQGNRWYQKTISLQQYDGQIAFFRFVGYSGNGPFGDIAIDQISFYKSIPASQMNVFYKDSDGDGYGDTKQNIMICASNAPRYYSKVAGDCDDNNSKIYPGAIEINCNGIDENCNGNADDLPEFNPISYQITKSNPTCNGSLDGQLSLNITGGTQPYKILWNNEMNGATISGLGTGIYHATITDLGGCIVKTDFFNLTSITTLNIIASDIQKTACLGKSTGKINIEHSTGIPPYLYHWSNGMTTKNIIDQPAESYTVTVTDGNKCSATAEFEIEANPSILSSIKSQKNPTCHGQENGSIEIETSNGILPISYLWNNGKTTSNIVQLAADTFTCTITDSAGCMNTLSVNLTQPSALTGIVVSNENIRCFGESNGSIKTNTYGGTSPYTYLWNYNNLQTDDIYNLKAGEYALTVTDKNGCKTALPSVNLTQPEPFIVSVDTIIPSHCTLGQDGVIILDIKGGTPGYQFAWNHSDSSSYYFDNLISGNYNITAFDLLGCKSSIPNVFLPHTNIDISSQIKLVRDNTCYKDKNGEIIVEILNGTLPLDYNWSQGIQYIKNNQKDTITQLSAGQYKLTITDADGCVGTSDMITILEKTPFTYTVDKIVANKCKEDQFGEIYLSVFGGNDPLNYSWNQNNVIGNPIKNLANGEFQATITDQLSCTLITEKISLVSESNIELQIEKKDDVNFAHQGEICIYPTSGKTPYQFSWSNSGENHYCLSNLGMGNYFVTVTDQLGCVISDSIYIDNTSNASNTNQNGYLMIYPNPVSNIIHISSHENIHKLDVINELGYPVFTKLPNNPISDIEIDLAFLQDGMYILSLQLQNGTKRVKLIKQ